MAEAARRRLFALALPDSLAGPEGKIVLESAKCAEHAAKPAKACMASPSGPCMLAEEGSWPGLLPQGLVCLEKNAASAQQQGGNVPRYVGLSSGCRAASTLPAMDKWKALRMRKTVMQEGS